MTPENSSQRRTVGGLLSPSVVWLGIFFVAPLAIVVVYSFARRGPYGTIEWVWTWTNYARSLDPSFVTIYIRSVRLAAITTLLCLLIGYPTAYLLAMKVPRRWRSTLLVLSILPFWTSFLVRTYAWRFILQDDGVLNGLLQALGLPAQQLLYTELAVLLGQTYGELPFMILPLYVAIDRLDPRLLEAASDLGASARARFLRVTLPLSRPGIIAGVVLVFVPSFGAFITPDLLGGAKSMMIGNLIQEQFVQRNQPFGAALSFILAAVVLGLLLIATRSGAMREPGGTNVR